MRTFIINISGDGDELEYLDQVEGEDFESIEGEVREMATKEGETLYVCEEGTDRWEEVSPSYE